MTENSPLPSKPYVYDPVYYSDARQNFCGQYTPLVGPIHFVLMRQMFIGFDDLVAKNLFEILLMYDLMHDVGPVQRTPRTLEFDHIGHQT